MKWFDKILDIYRKSDRFFYLLIGLPSYDKYLEHMKKYHPLETPKSRKEFFKQVQEARYSSNGAKKC